MFCVLALSENSFGQNVPLSLDRQNKRISKLSEIPAEAEKILNSLPKKQLSVEVVVGRAIEASADFKRVLAGRPQAEAPEFAAQAPLDWRVYAKGNYFKDDRESFSPISFTNFNSQSFSLGATTQFSTGTSLMLEAGHSKTEGRFSGQFANFYETKTTLALSQQLWENAFGYQTRKSLEAAEKTKSAMLANFEGDVEDWVIQMSGIYYSAWLSQEQAKSADENLKRRERLADLIRIRARRGTSEAPDVLQIEGGVVASKADQLSAFQALDEQWRGLVISLGFPDSFLDIDPRIVPMASDSPNAKALKLCVEKKEKIDELKVHNSRLKAAREMKVAAELEFEKAENAFHPSLEFSISAMSNGLDFFSRKTTFEEGLQYTYPGWGAGLTLSLPLENSAEKAQFAQSLSQQMRSRALAMQAEDALKIQWLNQCSDLERLQVTADDLWTAYQKQVERARLEERRFELGRTGLQSVINAGDDATRFRIMWAGTVVKKSMASWKVLQLSGELKETFKSELQKVTEVKF